MSTDLLTQLAEYGTDHEDRQPTVSADDILGVVVPIPVRTTRAVSPRGAVVGLVAAAVAVLVVAVPLLFSQSDSSPADSSTVPSTPTTTVFDASPTTTVTTATTVTSTPLATGTGTDALPPGWQATEITIPADSGDLVLGYTWDGRPMLLTTGYDCVDRLGVTRIGEINRSGFGFNSEGEECFGDEVEATESLYVATPDGAWGHNRDPVPGRFVLAPSATELFLQLLPCAPGTIFYPDRSDTCSAIVSTNDGVDWFAPTGTDGPFYLPLSPFGEWDRIDDAILVPFNLPGNTSSGTPREPTGVAWQYSVDAGRTFAEIAIDDAVYSSMWGAALSFAYRGAFRSIIWDENGIATHLQLSDLQWETIGTATGLPAADGEWVAGDGGRGDFTAVGTLTGPVYLAPHYSGAEPAVSYVSTDGGLTWSKPNTDDLPFASPQEHEFYTASGVSDSVLRIPWLMPMGDLLMFNTDSGTYLTDGTEWYPLTESSFKVERDGMSTRDPINLRLPVNTEP